MSLAFLAAGCIPPKVRDEIDTLRKINLVLQRQLADVKAENQQQAIQIEHIEREIFNKEYCRSGKHNEFNSRISQFIREVEKGIPGTCQPGPLQESLYFLRTQTYANFYLRPTESVQAIRPARIGQLIRMLDPKWFHPSTRLLVLMQPDDEGVGGHNRALDLGREVVKELRQLAPGRELKILGPHLLPCRLRSEIERSFNGPMDITLEGEPPKDTPRIRVWTFRTDCA